MKNSFIKSHRGYNYRMIVFMIYKNHKKVYYIHNFHNNHIIHNNDNSLHNSSSYFNLRVTKYHLIIAQYQKINKRTLTRSLNLEITYYFVANCFAIS